MSVMNWNIIKDLARAVKEDDLREIQKGPSKESWRDISQETKFRHIQLDHMPGLL
jgi:hypothetical protein